MSELAFLNKDTKVSQNVQSGHYQLLPLHPIARHISIEGPSLQQGPQLSL